MYTRKTADGNAQTTVITYNRGSNDIAIFLSFVNQSTFFTFYPSTRCYDITNETTEARKHITESRRRDLVDVVR